MKGFKQFILRGNVVDLAVGVIIGAAFGNLVNSLVKDMITPLIGAIAKVPDFSHVSFSINGSQIMLGNFLNVLIAFIIAAIAIYFLIVLPMNTLIARFKKGEEVHVDPSTKKCTECTSEIPIHAKRCPLCTSQIA